MRFLHDAVVDQFKFDAVRERLEAIIWERHENKPMQWWQLTVSGIRDKKHIQQIQLTIDAILAREKRTSLSFRIDEFSCKKQPISDGVTVYLVNLSIDHLPHLQLECAKCNLLNLNTDPFPNS